MAWPRSVLIASALVFAIGATGACGPKPQELDDLARALGQSKPVDELLSRGNSVKALNLGNEAWLTEQRRLLVSVDEALVTHSLAIADLAVANAGKQLKEAAGQQAQRVLVREQPAWFRDAVAEASEEVAKDQACQLILDVVAPKPPSPTSGGGADKPLLLEIAEKLVTALEKRASPPTGGWRVVVDLTKWGSATMNDAEQLARSVQAGTTDLTLLARPPVARAAVAYARMCYSPPRMP